MNKFLDKYVGSKVMINSDLWGKLSIESVSFSAAIDGDLIVIKGNPKTSKIPLVRIHSECVFSEIFHSDFCDCGLQLYMAMQLIAKEGCGILFYLRLDGRGAGLAAKVKATELEMKGVDTFDSRVQIGVSPEGRNFTKIGEYLYSEGYRKIRLLTNNPLKVADVEKSGIEVIQTPLIVENPNKYIKMLYKTKVEKFKHIIPQNV
jgi:GTP cyclohydrolase II